MNSQPEPEKLGASTSSHPTNAPTMGADLGEAMNWRAWYFLVLAALVAELVGFTLITNYFA